MAHDASVKYSESVTPDELTDLMGSVKLSIAGDRDQVEWECPRCHAVIIRSFNRDRPIYKFDVETADAPGKQGMLDLTCGCGIKHEGVEGKLGCGFAAHLPVEAS